MSQHQDLGEEDKLSAMRVSWRPYSVRIWASRVAALVFLVMLVLAVRPSRLGHFGFTEGAYLGVVALLAWHLARHGAKTPCPLCGKHLGAPTHRWRALVGAKRQTCLSCRVPVGSPPRIDDDPPTTRASSLWATALTVVVIGIGLAYLDQSGPRRWLDGSVGAKQTTDLQVDTYVGREFRTVMSFDIHTPDGTLRVHRLFSEVPDHCRVLVSNGILTGKLFVHDVEPLPHAL